MNTRHSRVAETVGTARRAVWIALLLSLLGCGSGLSQQYFIDCYTIGGGGDASTGGVYQVSGTIGQLDAGSMSGGPFSLVGGFWGILSAVQTPGSPPLAILNPGTNAVVLSWPSASTGFVLQQTSDLTTTNWTRVDLGVSDDGTTQSVIIAPAAGRRFFRLKYP